MSNTVHSTSQIMGGFILLPRAIKESAVSNMSPCAREIFNLFLLRANHKDVFAGGTYFKRGDLLITYREIQEALCWYVGWRKKTYSDDQCEAALKALERRKMITKRRTIRGVIVTVCDYDYWQTASNYENRIETDTNTTGKPRCAATINKNDKNEKNEKNTLAVVLNVSFDDFYNLYDKKVGDRVRLQKKWNALKDSERTAIMGYVPRYKKHQPEKKFRKNPDTFLNQRAWENEIIGEVIPMFDQTQYDKDKAAGFYDY